MTFDSFDIKSLIRPVIDFPKPGVIFRDITPLFQSPRALRLVADSFAQRYVEADFTHIGAMDARGFLIGSIIAYQLNKPLILFRKQGKLPADVLAEGYQTEYGEAFLEVHADSLCEGDSVLMFDDLIATGGTLIAAANLVRRMGAKIFEAAAIIDLPELGGSQRLADMGIPTYCLTQFGLTERSASSVLTPSRASPAPTLECILLWEPRLPAIRPKEHPGLQPHLLTDDFIHHFARPATNRQNPVIAIQPLHQTATHISLPAQYLHRVIRHPISGIGGQILGHGNLFDYALSGGHLRGLAIGELAGNLHGGSHFRQAMLEHLEFADGFAECFALGGPLEAFLQGQLRGHVGHEGQGQALALEVAHDAGKAHVLDTDEIAHRHAAVIEE